MIVDREKFLALALALSACAKHGAGGMAQEGGMVDPYADLSCTGFAWANETDLCVAWKGGRVKAGYTPTAECARWDEAGRCNATVFTKN